LLRVAYHDETAGQDLDVIGVASDRFSPAFYVGIERLGVLEIAAAGENHFRGLAGELTAGIGGPGLDDDRPALDRPGDVQRAAYRQELAFVVDHMHAVGVEIDALLDIADEGVFGPAVPEAGHDIVELAGAPVAL